MYYGNVWQLLWKYPAKTTELISTFKHIQLGAKLTLFKKRQIKSRKFGKIANAHSLPEINFASRDCNLYFPVEIFLSI